MSIETVRVTPSMLPPTISTTPNSPRVCAKLIMTPVTTPATDSGRVIRRKVINLEMPSGQAGEFQRENDRCPVHISALLNDHHLGGLHQRHRGVPHLQPQVIQGITGDHGRN